MQIMSLRNPILLLVLMVLAGWTVQVHALQVIAPEPDDTVVITPEEQFFSYRQRYQEAVSKAAQVKHQAIERDALTALRREAVEIIRSRGLGKNKIKNQLGPMLKKLEEALVPTPDEIDSVNGELSDLRKAVVSAGIKEKEVVRVERAVILYLLCDSNPKRDIIAGNLELRSELSNPEADAIDFCNKRRLLLGMRPLKIEMKLVEASRDHSKDMVEHKFFSHTSPVEGKRQFTRRANNFGTSASGENIAKGYDSGWHLFNGWWNSPGHLRNMMGNHRRVGIGQHKKHFTMLVGG